MFFDAKIQNIIANLLSTTEIFILFHTHYSHLSELNASKTRLN